MMRVINGPTYFIQNNWEEILSKVAGEVWITCKNRNEIGKHGTVTRVNTTNDTFSFSLSTTEGFRANLLTYNAIEVESTDSQFTCIFVAPRSVFSDVHKKSVTSLDVSDDSVCVSVSSEDECQVVTWLAENQGKLKTFREHAACIYKCRWFPSGQVLLSCGADMSLKIWCSETCRCPVTLRGHTKTVTDVAFVDRGRNIISVSKDGVCKLWDCGAAQCIDNLIELPSAINCCSVSSVPSDATLPECRTQSNEREVGTERKIVLLGCEDGCICCVAVHSRKVIFKKQLPSAVNCCCCIEPTLFAVGCQDGSISLIRALSDDPVIISWTETNSPALCALGYQSEGFFVGHSDGTCIYRTVLNLDCSVRLCLSGPNSDPVYDICCDTKFVYTACRDATIRKYSPDSYISRHFNNES